MSTFIAGMGLIVIGGLSGLAVSVLLDYQERKKQKK